VCEAVSVEPIGKAVTSSDNASNSELGRELIDARP
jgi:hypothetical protein